VRSAHTLGYQLSAVSYQLAAFSTVVSIPGAGNHRIGTA